MATTWHRELTAEPHDHRRPAMERSSGRVVMTGNELIVKGALEAGVSLITGYPGSPVAEVFTICERHAPMLRALGVEAILANNEAQSAAMLNGARQVAGARALAVMKSVGAYVALDALAIANSAKAARRAAAVVVVGDDPSLSSTQVGADSRLTLAAGRIPVLEPDSFQDVKDLVATAFDLSEESGLVVAVLVTTAQADGLAVVDVHPNRPPTVGPTRRVSVRTRDIVAADAVSLPPQAAALEADLLERRFPLLQSRVTARRMDRAEGPSAGPLGVVTAGASYVLVRDALAALGADGALPLLRLALTWPVCEDAITDFARGVGEIVVVEERAGHLEDQVRRAVAHMGTAVWGKRFPDGPAVPATGALSPDILRGRLAALVRTRPTAFTGATLARANAHRDDTAPSPVDVSVPPRTPTYCAGCPHRGTSSPMIEIRRRLADLDYMRDVHGREPIDIIAHGGIGCDSMAVFPPWNDMHDLSAMGLGGATGAGAAPLVTNKHYVLVGDGTFFHGEISTIANAVKQHQDILFVILDNKTTAMTGHQGTPGGETDLMGRPQQPVDIERVVRAMGPAFVARANPDDRDGYLRLLERMFLTARAW
ncbi:MAG: indolepyruvate ferredoxin oxidoreductase subunit alpha [Actinobacteria bacterium]|nr:indolepyruvate ferredoxin oxidoreductase subunit alpha [Actinomycetota bacterium]